MLVVQYQSAKLRGLRELVSRMDRVGAWVRGWREPKFSMDGVGNVGP